MRILAALFLLAASSPSVGAEEAAASSAPARVRRTAGPVFGAPLRFQFRVDERGKPRGELGFSVRWDAADIEHLPRRAARLAFDPFGTTERAAREALTGADVGVYTLRFRTAGLVPVDLLLSPLSALAGWFSPPEFAALAEEGEAPSPPPAPKDPHRRLSLTPARAEIERSLKRDLRRSLIDAGFELVVPVRQSVPFAQKQAVYESLRRAEETWDDSD
ncbi:MAG: hypothetical protein FD126_2833 [Elusimicrobia bacterium]|nr:MAG: hypothetical protein FD126_2833 [Elusimicrobiota bacterium]